MARSPIVLGVDPGFASLGLAWVRLLPHAEIVERLAVVTTAPSARKRQVLATDDNVHRLRELWETLRAALSPRVGVVACCVEAQSWPRNAGAAVKVAMVWGLLVAATEEANVPLMQVSPMEIKRAVTGDRKASKDDVQNALDLRYPEMPPWPAHREHCADALGAVVACLGADVIRMARRAAC